MSHDLVPSNYVKDPILTWMTDTGNIPQCVTDGQGADLRTVASDGPDIGQSVQVPDDAGPVTAGTDQDTEGLANTEAGDETSVAT